MKMFKDLVIPLVFAGWLLGGFDALGLTFLVTQTDDSIEETSLSGALLKKIKAGGEVIKQPSLRGAIIAANRRGGFHTILLQPKTYQLSIKGADEDTARTGDLDITRGNLTISVVGKGNVTINATGLGDRVFQVFSNAQVTLSHLTITGGKLSRSGYASEGKSGGAINNFGALTINHCKLINNAAGAGGAPSGEGGKGGGICNSGWCILNNSYICFNASGISGYREVYDCRSGDGGGVYNRGEMSLANCIVANNFTERGNDGFQLQQGDIIIPFFPGASGGNGAGIYNSGNMALNNCAVHSNTNGNGGIGNNGGSGGSGAGIYNSGELLLNAVTISRNTTGRGGSGAHGWTIPEWESAVPGGGGGFGGCGGGIFNLGQIEAASSTITENSASDGGNGGIGKAVENLSFGQNGDGGLGGSGGGIYNVSTNHPVLLRNTLVALNTTGIGGLGNLTDSLNPNTLLGNNGVEGSGPDLSNGFNSDIRILSKGFLSGGFNLIGALDYVSIFLTSLATDQVGSLAAPIDPLIGPLQMNGGPTPTHALLPGSPAIDQGRKFGRKFDQRGHRRPHDYFLIPNATGGDGSDIGEFELEN